MFKYESNEENENADFGDYARASNPIEMLREDHRKVQDLFQLFEDADDPESMREIAAETIKELKIHAAIEEEIFYPALRKATGADDLLDEAEEEHHVAKLLIAELEEMSVGDEHFEAKYKVLAESVRHHIREEESEMFSKAETAGIAEIGEEMHERKQELLQEYGQDATRKPRKNGAKKDAASSRRKSKR
jgi:hemerythrin superfamily protein